jgi:diguanylate cyclase (GGDEF)-like protein/PAS domain S-box-containing protein
MPPPQSAIPANLLEIKLFFGIRYLISQFPDSKAFLSRNNLLPMNYGQGYSPIAMPSFDDPEIYRDILDHLQFGVSVLDLQKKIVFWSDGAEQVTGYNRIEVLGHPCTDNILQHCNQNCCDMCTEQCPIGTALRDAKPVESISFFHHKSGYRTQVHLWAIPLRNKNGLIIGVVQTFEAELSVRGPDPGDRNLQEHGWLDEVTGLPNQVMMQSHFRETLGTFTELGIPFAIILVEVPELDRFRAKYGQGALRSILQVLARTLRNSVWPTDFVGHWSDSQFLVILMGCGQEALHAVSGRMLRMMARATIMWWGEELSLAVSLGRSAARTGDTIETLLRRAHNETQAGTAVRAASAVRSSS